MKKLIVKHLIACFLLVIAAAITSCEKITAEANNSEQPADGKSEVVFKIAQIEQIPFENTTRSVALSTLISRLSIAAFQGTTKVKVVNQTSADASFGTITMQLAPGTYQIVAIGHNGLGNCTISSTEKITFQNNKVTDTFYYYGTLNVTGATASALTLTRPVAMFRMKITENMPSNVVKMQFYYTGGSSTFNAVSGFGCVDSKQTETFTITAADQGKPSKFEIYTFPHNLNDLLNIKVTAFDAYGATVKETTLENISVDLNQITQHSEAFFTPDSVAVTPSVTIQNDGQWGSTIYQ